MLIHDGHCYEVSRAVVELLDCLRQCATRQEAVATFVEKRHGAYSVDQVEKQIATTYVDPILTVSKSSTVKRTFIYQRELLPAVVIDKFSDMFRLLFHKTVIWPVICIAIVATFGSPAGKQSVSDLLYGDYSMKFRSWYGFRSLLGSVHAGDEADPHRYWRRGRNAVLSAWPCRRL